MLLLQQRSYVYYSSTGQCSDPAAAAAALVVIASDSMIVGSHTERKRPAHCVALQRCGSTQTCTKRGGGLRGQLPERAFHTWGVCTCCI
jgi:hypothetical protein